MRGSDRYCPDHQADALQDLRRWRRADANRGSARQRGYTSKWERARAAYLRLHPICVDPYKRHPHQVIPATDLDHITPHRGDMTLFWDRDNWQPLCSDCHKHKTRKGL